LGDFEKDVTPENQWRILKLEKIPSHPVFIVIAVAGFKAPNSIT
jgi:hypothetical protein